MNESHLSNCVTRARWDLSRGGMLALFVLLSACSISKRSTFLDTPIQMSRAEARPVIIDVHSFPESLEVVSQGHLGSLLGITVVPFFPYATAVDVTVCKVGSIPEKGIQYRMGFQPGMHGPVLEPPQLIRNYLKESQLADQVLLDGAGENNPPSHALLAAGETISQADVIIETHFKKFRQKNYWSFYGLTGYVWVASLTSLNGSWWEYEYHFEATAREADTQNILVSKSYAIHKKSGFYPIFGPFVSLKKNAVDHLEEDIHKSCREFARELADALPPSSEEDYWLDVKKRRLLQKIRAEGKDNPVEFEVMFPHNELTTSQESILFTGRASSRAGLRSIRVLLNRNIAWHQDYDGSASPTYIADIELSLVLEPGQNRISIECEDLLGFTCQKTTIVTRWTDHVTPRLGRQERIRHIQELLDKADQMNPGSPEVEALRRRLGQIEAEPSEP